MDKRRLIISIIAGLLAALMIFGIVASIIPVDAAKSSSQIKEEINDLKSDKKKIEKELAKLEGQLSSNLSEMKDIVAQKNVIDQQVGLLHEQIQNINDEILAYNELIADKQAELDAATARWQELSDKYKERIRTMEEDGSVSYWAVLFKAKSFPDLLDRLNMIQEIAASDQRRLQELNDAAQEVADAKASLVAEKTALEASKTELEATNAKLEESRAETDRLLKELIATGDKYQKLIDEAEAKESEAKATLSKLEYEYDAAKEREYQEWLAQQKPQGVPNSGGWVMPIRYDIVTSGYGYRIHPIYGTKRMHHGIDLAAPKGRAIVASRSGIVTNANYESDAGYNVTINHMDGFASVYMHMTHYIVSKGDKVVAGQVIGYCGSTGASTGPHLHFGIYYNGSSVNPAHYLRFD
jgi:murein DD-endopeptidase MepM/ murein hydrolase activator NlpD